MPRFAVAVKKSLRSDPFEIDRKPYEAALPLPDVCHLASTGDRQCHAILDTGASKCVIREKIWKQLFQKLPSSLQQKVRKAPSQVKFRFGNNQTLQSEFQVQLPLQSAPHSNRRLWLTIEVLPGSTPFLFSKRAFKQLGGILDTTNDSFFLQRLDRKINLELNPTELYLLDVIQLCSHPRKSFFKSSFVTNHVSVQSKGVDCPHGPHDSECTVENISLTMAKPASRDSSSRSPCQSSSDSQHAASSPDDDVAEDRGRGGDQPVDDVAQVSDQPVRNCTRGPRKLPGSDASHGGNGPRAAESTNDVAKSHDFSPERPATKGPRFNWRFNCRRKLSATTGTPTVSLTSSKDTSRSCSTADGITKSCSGSAGTANGNFSDSCHDEPGVKLADDRGVRGGGDSRPRGPPDRSESAEPIGFDNSLGCHDSKGQHSDDRGGLGTVPHNLGEKAQGAHLHAGVASGSILLSVGGGPFCQPHTRSSRFREVLSSEDGSRSALQLRSVTKDPVVNSAFHDDVAKTRKFLNQSVPPKPFSPALANSICHASRILEEAFVPPAWSLPQKPCVLLEVYADQHSPLT